jgi:hypothetical protein
MGCHSLIIKGFEKPWEIYEIPYLIEWGVFFFKPQCRNKKHLGFAKAFFFFLFVSEREV